MARLVQSIELGNDIVDIYSLSFFKLTWISNTETITFYHYKFSNVYTFDFKDFFNSFEEMIEKYPIYKYSYIYNNTYKICKVYKEESNPHFNQIMSLWNIQRA